MIKVEAQFQAQWALDAGSVPPAVNQMLIQNGLPLSQSDSATDGYYVTFGHVNPPLFTAENAEGVMSEAAGTVLPVIPVARFQVSTERLVEFYRNLGTFFKANGIDVT